MEYRSSQNFGNLINQKKYDVRKILNQDTMHLDYLFKNSNGSFEELSVIQAERMIALENLRKLTNELQTKRLRYKARSSCKYFTL